MRRNIVSLFKRFGRQCFKSAQVLAAKRYVSVADENRKTNLRHQSLILDQVAVRQLHIQSCVVLTSLNWLDPTAELAKRIDLTADKLREDQSVCAACDTTQVKAKRI